MKSVVITGSARGFGYEMSKCFREEGFHVVLCDVSKENLEQAKKELEQLSFPGEVLSYVVDVTKEEQIQKMVSSVIEKLGSIDIWINNAGVNQPNQKLWELDEKTIDRLLDIDLKGAILGVKTIMPIMIKQKKGQIYNVEGHGSNNAVITGLSLYGTAKRAITYFTDALAHEVEENNLPICIGKITPGIMITNFIATSLGDGEKIELDEKTKNVYNILGDYPDVIAKFMVKKIIHNQKNHVKFTWLTNRKAAWRFMTSGFHKRDFFSK